MIITLEQVRVLRILWLAQPACLTAHDVAERVGVIVRRVQPSLARLVALGVVNVTDVEHGGRYRIATDPTPEARAALARVWDEVEVPDEPA